jgi:hypothetical protein
MPNRARPTRISVGSAALAAEATDPAAGPADPLGPLEAAPASARARGGDRQDGPRLDASRLVFVVYAPFGTDELLSTFPDGAPALTDHPLVQALRGVAAAGVPVVALIDRVGDDTRLLEIEPGRPPRERITSCWKQDMASPRTLAGLLRRAAACHPKADLVLALEGHGAGYLPEIDRRQVTHANLTLTPGGDTVRWEINPIVPDAGGAPTLPMGAPILPMGAPILPMGAPILPMGAPILPTNHLPLSTWALGEALRLSQQPDGKVRAAPRVRVVHLNNCFNLSVEVLHTLAPWADWATAYGNYNFFTAGESYPALFRAVARRGVVTAGALARGFARGNDLSLQSPPQHPTFGGTVRLADMKAVAEKLDGLSARLVAWLSPLAGLARETAVQAVAKAIARAQQLDSDGDLRLEVPDAQTDLLSLAAHLQDADLALPADVVTAAGDLATVLAGIKQYGAVDRPWMLPASAGVVWDFSAPTLAMNILLPDPGRQGLWDWRSPFYLAIDAENDTPRVQPHVIELLKTTDWVDFLKEYHRQTPFKGLFPARIPEFLRAQRGKEWPPRDRGEAPGQPPRGGKGSGKGRGGAKR